MIPRSTPQMAEADVRRLLKKYRVTDAVALLGVRGYYLRTMGDPARNDRGLYDDAIFLVGPEYFCAFNANTDPSAQYRHGVATLRPGLHRYKLGNHGISRPGGGYPALRPATPGEALPVDRDGVQDPRPGIAINIHRGGNTTTSSEGCQTIPPAQWPVFIAAVTREMKAAGQKTILYLLLEEKELR